MYSFYYFLRLPQKIYFYILFNSWTTLIIDSYQDVKRLLNIIAKMYLKYSLEYTSFTHH